MSSARPAAVRASKLRRWRVTREVFGHDALTDHRCAICAAPIVRGSVLCDWHRWAWSHVDDLVDAARRVRPSRFASSRRGGRYGGSGAPV